MVTIDALQDFERHIRAVLSRFERAFGTRNPIALWRRGQVARFGVLSDGEQLEYSFHGVGCTVEVAGRVVSFDFDPHGTYCYSVFKFLLFVDDESVDEEEAASEFKELAHRGALLGIPGYGIRLAEAFRGDNEE